MSFDFNYENATITSSGGFKPAKKNMPIDIRTIVDTHADIASIPNPYVGLTVTVKADETNNGKMTDYKVLSLKANALGAADTVINEVKKMNEYLEVEVDLSDLTARISALETSVSDLTNKNTTLTNKITTLETKVAELDLQLNPPIVEKMYYGRLSIEEVGGSVIQYSQITEQMILNGNAITVSDPQTLGKTSMGLGSETAEGDYIVVAVPSSRNYTVTQDNGIGGKTVFSEDVAGANGINITIAGVECKLYGEILLSQGEKFIYID